MKNGNIQDIVALAICGDVLAFAEIVTMQPMRSGKHVTTSEVSFHRSR